MTRPLPVLVRDVPGRAQVGGEFGGVVRVAVEHPHPARLALELHPALRAAVAGDGRGHPGRREAELDGGGEGGGSVQGVVVTGHVHRHLGEDLTERAAVSRHGEADRHPPGRHVDEPVVGVRGLAVPADARGIQARRDGLRARVVRAGQHHAGDPPAERGERRLDVRQARVVVQVVGLDVGDDRDVGREQQERPVALVRLGDEVQAGAVLRAEPGLGEDPADDVARVGAAFAQHRGEHGGGGGLAVRPRDRDHPPAGHDRGQRRRPVQHPHPAPGRLGQFRVVRPDGAGHHQRVAGAEAAELPAACPTCTLAPSARSSSSSAEGRASLPETGCPGPA